MLKIILLNIILLLFCFNLFAAVPVFTDTTVKLKTKEAFLQKYGTNDTSKMIIEYFFFKRKNKKIDLYIMGSGLAITGTMALTIKPPVNPNIYAGLAGAGLALAAFFISAVAIFFSVGLARYSKKRLAETLAYYQDGNVLPQWLQRKNDWAHFCKWVYPNLKKKQ